MSSSTAVTIAARGFGMMLEKSRGTLEAHNSMAAVSVDSIIAGAKLAAAQLPALYNCSPQSVMIGVYRAARLGLELGGPMGHAYLIPFKTTATLIVGYKGLIELALRSGRVTSIIARVVREGDTLDIVQGSTETLTHKPLNLDHSRPVTAVYAVATLLHGPTLFDVMTVAEIEKVRAGSRSGQDGPWVNEWDQMARKTAIRRLSNVLPMSPELAAALELIDREMGKPPTKTEILDVEEVEFEEVPAVA